MGCCSSAAKKNKIDINIQSAVKGTSDAHTSAAQITESRASFVARRRI